MGIPDGAHTHGGGFDPMPIVVIIAALAAASGIASAVAALAHLLLITLAVVAITLAVVIVAGAVIAVMVVRHRLRHPQPRRALLVNGYQPPPRPVRAPIAAPAIEAPRQNHIHFHGVTPADMAAVLREQNDGR